jgi:hypothetical protein
MATTLPTPVVSDLRFAWRVDYFATDTEALAFYEAKRSEGFSITPPSGLPVTHRTASGEFFENVYGVHWSDRPGEGWYQ